MDLPKLWLTMLDHPARHLLAECRFKGWRDSSEETIAAFKERNLFSFPAEYSEAPGDQLAWAIEYNATSPLIRECQLTEGRSHHRHCDDRANFSIKKAHAKRLGLFGIAKTIDRIIHMKPGGEIDDDAEPISWDAVFEEGALPVRVRVPYGAIVEGKQASVRFVLTMPR